MTRKVAGRVLALLLCGSVPVPATAQQRPAGRLAAPVAAPRFHSVPVIGADSAGAPGLAGAILGGALGTAAALPWFLVAASEEGSCARRGREAGCYTPLVPLLLGSALGTSGGAALGGGDAAPGWTAIGALIGTGFGAALVFVPSPPVDGGAAVGSLLAPAVGAILGNRLGQRH